MNYRRTTVGLAAGFGLSILASALIPSCAGYPTCEERGYCPGEPSGFGGFGGVSAMGGAAAGGDTSGNAGDGAMSGNSGSSGTVGGSGGTSGSAGISGGASAGMAGAVPCDGDCKGLTPVCDTASNECVQCLKGADCKAPTPACDATMNTCVECTKNTDCKDAGKTFCDASAQQCVACLKQIDCTSATASACNAGQCKACTVDAECSNIAGKGVCNAGTCVQCSVGKESACGGKSCDPILNQCTTTAVGSRDLCEPCVADSECIGGNQTDPDTRCVPMKFMGVARPGGFCLKRFSKTCSRPYFLLPTNLVSLSGATAETYCGVDQDSTRCEAVLDFVNSRPCADSNDNSCGCARDKNGACTEVGQGGLCKTVLGVANTCTIPCGNTVQCSSATTCPSVNYCH